MNLIACIPKSLSPFLQYLGGHHPHTFMAVDIARKLKLGQATINSAVDHQLKAAIKHHPWTVLLAPFIDLYQGIFNGHTTANKVSNDGGQNKPCRRLQCFHGMANKRYFSIGITKYTGAHIQSGSHTALMNHLNKILHALAKASRVKQKGHLWDKRVHPILEEMASRPAC